MARPRFSPPALAVLALIAGMACGDGPAGVRTLPVLRITVTPDTLVLPVGRTVQLTATVRDSEGRDLPAPDLRWSSNAPAVAAVSASGVVTALEPGSASIGAHADQSVGFARIVVQFEFRLPVSSGMAALRAETGTPTSHCPGGEGGLRASGGWDCTHSGISRYSLDFQPADEFPEATEVRAAADGIVRDVCRQPPEEVTCGPNGPLVYVEHGSGFATLYSHLDPRSIAVRRKTTIAQGDLLGRMGTWGADEYPWVHFEMRYNGLDSGENPVLRDLLVEGRKLTDYRVRYLTATSR